MTLCEMIDEAKFEALASRDGLHRTQAFLFDSPSMVWVIGDMKNFAYLLHKQLEAELIGYFVPDEVIANNDGARMSNPLQILTRGNPNPNPGTPYGFFLPRVERGCKIRGHHTVFPAAR